MSMPGRDRLRRPRVILAPEIADVAGAVTARLPDLVDRVVQRIRDEFDFYREGGVVGVEGTREMNTLIVGRAITGHSAFV